MNPGIRPNRRGQLLHHSKCLEKVGHLDWTATLAQDARIGPKNCNKKEIHSIHPNVMGQDTIRSDSCNDDCSRLRRTRESCVDKSRIRKSIEDDERIGLTNNHVSGARRATGNHRGRLSSTGSVILQKLSPSVEPPQTNGSFGCYPETKDRKCPSSNRSMRPLVNRRATADFDSMEVQGNDGEYADLQEIQFHDLVSNGSMTAKGFPGRHTFIFPRSPKSEVQQILHSLGGSKQCHVLKISLVDLSFGDASFIEDMKKEARVAAELRHPNICELQGVIRESKYFGLAYEFCGRGLLSSLILDRTIRYSVVAIARDVVRGMAYLHSRRIIHRDLKPSNILLTSNLKAKVGEFGMCVVNEDVYSFGVCLWQLVTRDIPFATHTPLQAAFYVAKGRRPSIPKKIPCDIQEAISDCWDNCPNSRPTFVELVQIMEKRQGLVYPITPSSERRQSKENLKHTEKESASNSATDPELLVGGYLAHDDLCTGGDGIGLEI